MFLFYIYTETIDNLKVVFGNYIGVRDFRMTFLLKNIKSMPT